ncbi:MAG: CmcJ/NvfI family oxidoreductase [Betaproteobacteria bacterium]
MPLVVEKPSADTLRARFNYIVDTGVPPVRYIDWPEMADKAVPPQYRQYEMTVRNGRPLRDTFDFDTHGFVFVEHRTRVRDFTDEAERKRIYDPEVQALIRKHTGASDVVVFDHTIRVSDEAQQQATNARPTVKGVHNDYTEASAPRRLREIVGDEEAARRMKKRWAIVQVWRPIRGTVMIDPLGICDGRSIPREGFIRVERRYKYRTGEVYHIAHNPAHVWYYFPRMERHEALVFKVFDSDAARPSRFTAHSAFDDPGTPPDAPPRESIETRTFAFFD